jgi:lysozyme
MKCPKCGYSDESVENKVPIEISEIGLSLIKSFEGKYYKGYLCPAGKWTIGYGHTGETFGQPSPKGMRISDADIDKLLKEDMARFEKAVLRSVVVPLSQHQFDALVSFAFNVGAGALATSTLLKKLNAGDYAGAAEQFLVWNKITNPQTKKKEVNNGLVRRRQAERHMFLTGELKVQF